MQRAFAFASARTEGDEHRQAVRSAVAVHVYLVGEIGAAIADEDTTSRDQLPHLGSSGDAEGVREAGDPARLAAPSTPCHATLLYGTRSCRDIDDLIALADRSA